MTGDGDGAPGGRTRAPWHTIAFVAAALVGLAAFAVAGYLVAVGTALVPTTRKVTFARPGIGGDFALVDQHGEPFALHDLRGKAVLVFFGYTHCADTCPTTLAALARVEKGLGADAARARVVFVSVDPGRDTPERLADYVASFDPRFIGLTGSEDAVAEVARRYGSGYRRGEPKANGDYDVEHSAFVYLVGPDGKVLELYPGGEKVAEMIAGVRAALAGG